MNNYNNHHSFYSNQQQSNNSFYQKKARTPASKSFIPQKTEQIDQDDIDVDLMDDDDEDDEKNQGPIQKINQSININKSPVQKQESIPLVILDNKTKKFVVSPEGINFKVSARAQACTQGIWIWGSPLYNEKSRTTIFLLDSQGSGAVDKNQTHDAKIFSLVVLISSLFIYNSFGVIDEKAIESLSLAAKLSRNIHFSSKKNEQLQEDDRLSEIAPKFIWILRDFFLELRDAFDNEISQEQYLEKCLQHDDGVALTAKTKSIRMSLLKIFKDRQCITMPRPVEEQSDLQRLNQLNLNDMRPLFQKKIRAIRTRVEGCPSKQMNGTFLTGPILAGLIQGYARSLNQGVVPNLTTEWDHIRKTQIKEAFNAIQSKLLKDFKILNQSIQPDAFLEEEQIYQQLLKIQELNMKFMQRQFERLALTAEQMKEDKDFELNIKKIENLFKKQKLNSLSNNSKFALTHNKKLAAEQYQSIEQRIANRKYFRQDIKASQEQICTDMTSLCHNYKKQSRSSSKLPIFTDFMSDKFNRILQAVVEVSEKRIHDAERKLQIVEIEKGDEIQSLSQKLKLSEDQNNFIRDEKVKIKALLKQAEQQVISDKDYKLKLKKHINKLQEVNEQLNDKLERIEEEEKSKRRKQRELQEAEEEDDDQQQQEEDEDEEQERKRSASKKKQKKINEPSSKKTVGCSSCNIF